MSSQAITRRIRAVSELRDLCLKLGESRPLAVKEEFIPYKTTKPRYLKKQEPLPQ
jgi:hypothetical protein